jgi:hypothetical protein
MTAEQVFTYLRAGDTEMIRLGIILTLETMPEQWCLDNIPWCTMHHNKRVKDGWVNYIVPMVNYSYRDLDGVFYTKGNISMGVYAHTLICRRKDLIPQHYIKEWIEL